MAAFTLTCPECRKTSKGSAELEGKRVRCPHCQAVFAARTGETLKVDLGGSAAASQTASAKAGQAAASSADMQPPRAAPTRGPAPQPALATLPEGMAWMVGGGIQTEEPETPVGPRRKKHADSGSVADPNLTPLLDVVLQLIMFFMITVNFVQTEALNEDVNLPSAQAAVPLAENADDYIFLNMNRKGKLVGYLEDLNNEVKLRAHLMREAEARRRAAQEKGRKGDVNIVIVLRADKEARYADIWHVLDTCQKAGYKRWQLRVLTKPA
jgi:biopolymer transport protein ExbD